MQSRASSYASSSLWSSTVHNCIEEYGNTVQHGCSYITVCRPVLSGKRHHAVQPLPNIQGEKKWWKNVLEAYSTLVRWNAATCFFQPISHAVAQKRISIHGYILWEEKTKETFVAAFSNLLAKNAFNIAVKLIFICVCTLFMLICKENLIVSRNLSNLYSYWIQQKYITWIFHFQSESAHSVL